MASIEFSHVSKSFGSTKVIEDLSLVIEDGKFTVLVGPSGCGKTTLLRMIAGIGPQTSGRVLIDGTDVSDTAPGKRGVAMVFQNYAIYPTMTVRENIEFGLINNRVPKKRRDELIRSISQTVGLQDMLDRKPGTLSGGQRQRVALARAMVKEPNVFLMDEPLSNLDAKLRAQMRVELIELHRTLGTTFVYVTHDQVEAMSMADVVVLMDQGRIMQVSPPEEIYRDPDNLFTAKFIGTPPMNSIPCAEGVFGFRPEHTLMSLEAGQDALFTDRGRIVTREMLGAETIYQVRSTTGRAYMIRTADASYRTDQEVFVQVPEHSAHFFDARGDRVRPGSAVYQSYAAALGAKEGMRHAQ
jgi:sn-glycerol 3-phosphate transport system ATP-binding protein